MNHPTVPISRHLRTALRRSTLVAASLIVMASGSLAQSLEEVSFGTNWRAQAEHGGFYQAVADGTYEACGLDVTIVPGGPQVNNRQLMIAGRIDFYMGGDLLNAFNAVAEGIPSVVVAAMFQKHPQVIIAHPGAAESWEDLKNLTILISQQGYQTYYQWMMAEFGFTEEQRDVYLFNPAPFLADESVAMQGFISSEPYTIETEAGFTPNVFLMADAGFATYSTTIEAMQQTIDERPETVRCFVEGSILGWYNYLYGDNDAANAMIMADNPEMTEDRIAYAIETMIENGIVDSGDALDFGIGMINPEKVGAFFQQMADVGVIDADLDWEASFTTEFVGNGVGLDLRPGN